uniref:Ssu-2 homolog, related sequence 1 n=1 Tax=Cyprinus carpio TaxID=7962 RepID=A0A8C2FV51_CYPCA
MAGAPAASMHGPSAPPANMFDTVPGYEGTVAGGGGGYLPPPMPSVPMPVPEQAPNPPVWHIPSISEDRARQAFSTYVSSKCCYSSAPVREGTMHLAQPPAFFQEHKQTIKVPYTSSVKNCHLCLGMGRNPCTKCAGAGNKVCQMCNGSGYRHSNDRCTHCNGRGRENCSSCSGSGSCQCDTCRGKGKLLVFINLNVKWSIEKDEFVAQDSSGLRVKKLEEVSGKELYKDAQYMVYPVRGFPDASVAQASERLVRDHQGKYAQTSRILQQRQTIELIPITKVNYMWKGKPNVYYVYGNEFKVNADDYPATCCCSVM